MAKYYNGIEYRPKELVPENHEFWGPSSDWRKAADYIESSRDPKNIWYKDHIEAANKRAKQQWDSGARQDWYRQRVRMCAMFAAFYDHAKELERRYNIDALSGFKKAWWEHAFRFGQMLAKARKEQGLGTGIVDWYDVLMSRNDEGPSKYLYWEFTDTRLHAWNMRCWLYQAFRDLGKTEEEIREMAPIFCSDDMALFQGFNPNLEAMPYPCIRMAGDDHCTTIIEYHPEYSEYKDKPRVPVFRF